MLSGDNCISGDRRHDTVLVNHQLFAEEAHTKYRQSSSLGLNLVIIPLTFRARSSFLIVCMAGYFLGSDLRMVFARGAINSVMKFHKTKY